MDEIDLHDIDLHDSAAAPRPIARVGMADSAEQQLSAMSGLPLAEHPEAYQRIHAELQRALADIDGT